MIIKLINKYRRLIHFLVVYLLSAAGSYTLIAQNSVLDQDITLKLSDTRISSVFKTLSRKTAYYFTYDTRLVDNDTQISIAVADLSLKEVLDTIFYNKELNYSVIDNHVIIYRGLSESTPVLTEEGKEPVYSINGLIVDGDNRKALPYATIGIKSRARGTISNHEGMFSLNVDNSCLDDTLTVSYLGYYSRSIPVNQAIESFFEIKLERNYVPIPEVIIRNRQPSELIAKMLENKRKNYGSSPASITAFYRESVNNKGKMLEYSEAVLELYKTSYGPTIYGDQVKVFKSRKVSNADSNDTLILRLQSGIDGCLQLDGVRNGFEFIDPDLMDQYKYHMIDIVNIGDDAAFVIEFEQREEINQVALFRGALYINTSDYGLHAAEFEINPAYIGKLDRNYVQQSARGFSVKPRSVKYRVSYRKIKGRYYLNHSRGDLEFYARKKNKLFGKTYNIFFEMAVNRVDTVNVERFAREERTPSHIVFGKTINSYDRDFWGTDNFLNPEESIEDALNRVSTRLSRFSNNYQESGTVR